MKRLFPTFIVIAFISSMALLTTSSCNKNRALALSFSVIDSVGEAVPSTVLIYCSEPLCVVEDSSSTGQDGIVEFVFPNPGILLVDVIVSGTRYEGGFVELEAGETVSKEVELDL